MPNLATLRKRRLRMTKAQLITEIDTLEQRATATEATNGNSAPIRVKANGRYLTKQQLAHLARFTSENPNPELRVMPDGTVLYANDAAIAVNGLLKGHKKSMLADDLVEVCADASHTTEVRETEFGSGDRIFAFSVAPVAGENYINIYGREITERKQTERALLESEERFRTAFETAVHGMNIITLDGRFLAVNNSLCEMLGYSEEEILATDIQSITHPEDIDRDLTNLQALLAGEIHSYQLEKRYVHKQGHPIDVSLSATVIRDSNGDPLYSVGHIQDITERKQVEEEFRKSEEVFRGVFESGASGMALLSMDGTYVKVNPKFCEIVGYTEGELYEKTWRDISHPEDIEEVEAYDRDVAAGRRRDFSTERRFVRKDGAIVRTRLLSAQICDQEGTPRYIFSSNQDITELKAAEEAVKQSEAQLRAVVKYVPGGVFMLDKNLNYIFTNNRYVEIFDIPDGLAEKGKPIEGVVRHLVLRDVYGEGNVDELVEQRLAQIREDIPAPVEVSLGDCLYLMATGRMPSGERIGIVTDITQRKRAEAEAAQRSAQLRATVDSMPDGILLLDDALTIITFNQLYRDLFNFPKSLAKEGESMARIFQFQAERGDFGDDEDLDVLVKERFELFSSGNPFDYQWELANGHFIEIRGNPVPGIGLVISYTDITERKRAEAALAEKESHFRTLVDNIPGIVYRAAYDKDWTMQFISDAVVDVTGYPASDFIGNQVRSFESIIHPEDSTLVLESVDAALNRREPFVIEYRIIDVEGTTRWVYEKGQGVFDDEGNVRYFDGTIYDNTEQKKAERELAEQKAVLEATMETMDQGISMVDKNLNILAFNHKFLELLELPEDMFEMGRSMEDYFRYIAERGEYGPGDVNEQVRERIELAAKFEARRFERTRPDGTVLEIRRNPMAAGGFVTTYTDTTERKRIEEELRQARETAEAATRSKSAFLATMSHEIRTPMNGVIGMVDLLAQSRLDDDQQRMIRTVRDSGYALLTIINDILDFSKIEAGKLELEQTSMSLEDVVESTAKTLAPSAARKDVEIITYVHPTLSEPALGDPVRVRQILFNLGGNAIKFSDKGQRIVIRADRLDAGSGAELNVCLRVIDEGIGISKEGQQRLFEVFSQVEASTTRKYGGTGLGLSICKRLTEMMGGEIGVKSEEGEGSEFYVTLPFQAASTSRISEKPRDLSGLRVLVVTRYPVRGEACHDDLAHWGAEVEISDDLDGVEGQVRAAKVADKAFDIIVLADATETRRNIELRQRFLDEASLPYPRFVIARNPALPHEALTKLGEVTLVDSNPIKRADLVTAVAVAAGRASPQIRFEEEVTALKAAGPTPTVEEALERGQLILVAEDNVTNQDVIRRQLNLLGYQCEIASDGREALELWGLKSYGILLTDCHMPEIDGFELTAAIRESEEGRDKRAPIVAITASALQGEAERCLAAGMDDYLTKPIETATLQHALEKWLGSAAQPASVEPSPAAKPIVASMPVDRADTPAGGGGNHAIDERALKDMFGDDPETFKEILTEFLEAARANIQEIQNGREHRVAAEVEAAAHKLKSSARAVGANQLADLCYELEQAGKANDWSPIMEGTGRLSTVIDDVACYVASL